MEDNHLQHFGVQGMKWGKRTRGALIKVGSIGAIRKIGAAGASAKKNESDYQKKLTALNKNKSLQGTSDAARFQYRNQNVAKRFVKTAASLTAQMLIADAFSGKLPTNKKDIAIKAAKIAALTTANVGISDALAKSASKRYTSEGERVKGTKNRLMTKEDGIEMGVGVAVKAAYIGKWALGMKAKQVNASRARNEANFNRWGANILPQRVDNVVWQSSDLKTAIIDNRRR